MKKKEEIANEGVCTGLVRSPKKAESEKKRKRNRLKLGARTTLKVRVPEGFLGATGRERYEGNRNLGGQGTEGMKASGPNST